MVTANVSPDTLIIADSQLRISQLPGYAIIVVVASMRYTGTLKNNQAVLPMRLKALFRMFALVIAMALAAGYVFLHLQDYSRIKNLIEQAVTDASGRRLVIHGNLELALSLKPELEVQDVTLANTGWGSQPQMMTIGRLRVRLKLLPLFRGDVEFKDIRLVETRLLLETDTTGQANWHFTPVNAARADRAVRKLGIKRLGIDKLSVSFRDGEAGSEEQHYTLAYLNLSRSKDKNSLAVRLEGSSNGQPLSLTGNTGLLSALVSGSRFPLALSGEIAGARVSLKGSIENVLTLTGIKLDAQASGSDLSTIGPDLLTRLPHTSRFDMKAHLSGEHGNVTVSQLQGSFDLPGLKLGITGGISDLAGFSGIQLEVSGSGDDLAQLGAIVGEALPSSGPFDVSGRISGSASDLALHGAQGSISRKDLKLMLTGSINNLLDLNGIDLKANASGNNLAQLGPVLGQPLPQTGPFTISGRLTGSTTVLALGEAHGNISRDKVKLSLTGKISDLLTLEGIDVRWNGSAESLAELNALMDITLPETGPFKAAGRLTGTPRKLTLRSLNGTVHSKHSRLNVTGHVDDLLQLKGIDLGYESSGKDFAELGSLFNTQLPELGPFSLSGELSGSTRQIDIKGFSANIDNSDFNGWSTIVFGKKPVITVRLKSGLIDFTRIMDQISEDDQSRNTRAGTAAKTPFSRDPLPLDVLNAVDADISLHARNLKARDAKLEIGKLALRIDDGRLRVDTLEAVYRKARISTKLNVRSGPPHHVTTRFLVQDFEFGRFLKETDITDEVEVKADLAADLGSLGRSAYDLASNLDGVFAAVFGKGRMPRFLDLLAEDLSQRVISVWGSHKEAGNLNCGVVHFGVQQGIATSNAFLFDTQVGYLKGKGSINLATEQIDFRLSPHPRDASLFSLKTKIRVSGSVDDPRVRPDSRSLAIKGSKALSALVIGPAGLLAPFVSLGARNQHPCDMQALRSRLDEIYQ